MESSEGFKTLIGCSADGRCVPLLATYATLAKPFWPNLCSMVKFHCWVLERWLAYAGLRVAAQDGPLVRFALDHGGGEPEVDGRVAGVEVLVHPGEQAVLQVGHDPGAAAGSGPPDCDVPEVDGFHVAVAVVVV